jgi:hypothetical protein
VVARWPAPLRTPTPSVDAVGAAKFRSSTIGQRSAAPDTRSSFRLDGPAKRDAVSARRSACAARAPKGAAGYL